MTPIIRLRDPVGSVKQGEKESIAYGFDWSRFGTPTNPAVVLEIESDGTDVSATLLSGAPSVAGSVVTTPFVEQLTRNIKYRLSCQATITEDANTYEAYAFIFGDR